MTLKQIPRTKWLEVASPAHLCRIRINYLEIEKRLDVKFFDYIEDGLGPAKGVYLESNDICCFLREVVPFADEPEQGVVVAMLSYEPSPSRLLSIVTQELELSRAQLIWVREPLCAPQWHILNLVENDIEYVMHNKHSALFLLHKLANNSNGKFELKYIDKTMGE